MWLSTELRVYGPLKLHNEKEAYRAPRNLQARLMIRSKEQWRMGRQPMLLLHILVLTTFVRKYVLFFPVLVILFARL